LVLVPGNSNPLEYFPAGDIMTTQAQFEPLMQADDAASLLGGMHPKTLMRLARNGEVPAVKIGRTWFFRASTLDEWVKSQQHRPCLTERFQ
jgi:excisionase family DNA binding protein